MNANITASPINVTCQGCKETFYTSEITLEDRDYAHKLGVTETYYKCPRCNKEFTAICKDGYIKRLEETKSTLNGKMRMYNLKNQQPPKKLVRELKEINDKIKTSCDKLKLELGY